MNFCSSLTYVFLSARYSRANGFAAGSYTTSLTIVHEDGPVGEIGVNVGAFDVRQCLQVILDLGFAWSIPCW